MREVLVKIKSASHRWEDLEIPCQLSLTVKELKKLIQSQYPLHPEVGDQRLIYAGHLLEDSQTLAEVLLPNSELEQSSFTLHLACTSNFFQSQRQPPLRTQKTKEDVPVASASPPIQPASASQGVSVIPPELLGLHQFYVNQMMAYMTQWSQGQYNSTNWNTNQPQSQNPSDQNQIPNVSRDFPENIQDATLSGRPADLNTQGIPASNSEADLRVAEITRAEEAARAAAEAARIANAARVAAAREDEEAPRDVIDWMYTFSRVALIFSVVYFYSNFTRFFLVIILSALVFLLQRRPFLWNGRQPAAPEARIPPRPRAADNQGQPRDENYRREPEDAAAPMNGIGDEANAQETEEAPVSEENLVELIPEAQEDARINPRDVTWTFLTTFFTSLIPEIPQN